MVDFRNWQGKWLYEGFKGHSGDPSELQSHGVGVETKPDHALCFATEGLGAVGRVGADWAITPVCPGQKDGHAQGSWGTKPQLVCLGGWRSQGARKKG